MDNTLRNLLKQMVETHGPNIFDDQKQFKALLKDYAKGENKKEIALLLDLLLENPSETGTLISSPVIIEKRKKAQKTESFIAAKPGMVLIDGGTFIMGDTAHNSGKIPPGFISAPAHEVRLDSFYLGNYPVTRAEYAKYAHPDKSNTMGSPKKSSLPVVNVSWYEAVIYCNKKSEHEGLNPAYIIDKNKVDTNNTFKYDEFKFTIIWNRKANGYRLPTESEWEYACRAGTTTVYSTGNTIAKTDANFSWSYPSGLSPVGFFPPNPLELFDMHGNVLEWCWDWLGEYEKKDENPAGPGFGECRILRGGAYHDGAEELASARRFRFPPCSADIDKGFRLARSYQREAPEIPVGFPEVSAKYFLPCQYMTR